MSSASGMPAPGGVVAADELGRRRVEEHHAHVVAVGAQFADLGEHFGVLASGDERQALDVAAGLRRQLDDRADQRGGQVVDHEPAEVLQHVGGPGATRAGQPGDQHDVGHPATLPIHPEPPRTSPPPAPQR